MIRLYSWIAHPNFGDAISKPIVEWVSGQPVNVVARAAGRKMVAVGSVLQSVVDGDAVWGAGVHPSSFDKFWQAETSLSLKVMAVRGPLTRDALLSRGIPCPPIYGDPAILLPRLHAPAIEKKYRIGIIPHMRDQARVNRNKLPSDVTVLDVGDVWQTVVNGILSCERIISSSLHGVIIPEAYGIPATWWRPTYKEGFVKYLDYYASTGRIPTPRSNLMEEIAADNSERLPALANLADGLVAAFDKAWLLEHCAD